MEDFVRYSLLLPLLLAAVAFVRRHKGPVLAASLVILALVGGIIGTTWGMIRARRGC